MVFPDSLLVARLPISIGLKQSKQSHAEAAVTKHVGPTKLLVLWDSPEVEQFKGKTLVFRITLPDMLDTIELYGRLISHTSKSAEFFLLAETSSYTRWLGFVTSLQASLVDANDNVISFEGHRKRMETFNLKFETLDKFLDFTQIDIHLGGIFIPTTRVIPIGSLLVLSLIHPVHQTRCTVDTRVVRHVGGSQPGLSVRFCHDAHLIQQRLSDLWQEKSPTQETSFSSSRIQDCTWPFIAQP